jgi:hypothetical protein
MPKKHLTDIASRRGSEGGRGPVEKARTQTGRVNFGGSSNAGSGGGGGGGGSGWWVLLTQKSTFNKLLWFKLLLVTGFLRQEPKDWQHE